MDQGLYKSLLEEGSISEESFAKVCQKDKDRQFSLHWETRSVLYSGIVLFTAGLGALVYKNIDSIGHQAVLVFIALVSAGCFAYCFKNKPPFSTAKVKSPGPFFDYILLLACLSFVIFIGYIQFQYHVFGNNYSLTTLIPTLLLFFTAYYFDHLGILNMAIASFAVWLGVSVTPSQMLLNANFDHKTIVYTYLFLGIFLLVITFITGGLNFKKHFKFSYQHYGVHVTFIALFAGYVYYFYYPFATVWLFGMLLLTVLLCLDAMKNKSFYFLLLAILYGYMALTSLVVRVLIQKPGRVWPGIVMLYFIISGAGLLFLLINLNKKIKAA